MIKIFRNLAGVNYLKPCLDESEKTFLKIGHTKDKGQREKTYRSCGNFSIPTYRPVGDEVDEPTLWHYYRKYNLGKEDHFEDNPYIRESFDKISFEDIYLDLYNDKDYMNSIYDYDLVSDDYYIYLSLYDLSSKKKAVQYWRALSYKFDHDFFKLTEESSVLERYYKRFFNQLKDSSTKELMGDVFLMYLTTYDKEVREELEDQFYSLNNNL